MSGAPWGMTLFFGAVAFVFLVGFVAAVLGFDCDDGAD